MTDLFQVGFFQGGQFELMLFLRLCLNIPGLLAEGEGGLVLDLSLKVCQHLLIMLRQILDVSWSAMLAMLVPMRLIPRRVSTALD